MIQITPHMRIFLATEPVDFRKGIDGLVSVCRKALNEDPFSGGMFIFRNKRRTTLKILLYDGQGFWLFVKRLSRGKFDWWPQSVIGNRNGNENEIGSTTITNTTNTLSLSPAQLHLLLWNGDPSSARIGKNWKRIKENRIPAL
jgi:hypothetical protein